MSGFQSLQHAVTLEEHRRLTAGLSRPLTDPHMPAIERASDVQREALSLIDKYATGVDKVNDRMVT